MAMFNPLELLIWALLVTFAGCWVALMLMPVALRRKQQDDAAGVDSLHVHCFPLNKKAHRKCLICGVRA